jgi:hypothetical protein
MEESLVYSIMARNPVSRAALLKCGSDLSSGCMNIEENYIAFAMRDDTLVKDLIEENAEFLAHVQQYNDRHREANGQQPQTPVLKPSEDD